MTTMPKLVATHKFPYEWRLTDGFPAKGIKYHGAKVFSCFAGGGGSSMGYKLAGYDVLGCNEIDPRMADCYARNLKPKIMMRQDIRELVVANDLPDELYNLDVLDGSPPCSTFSMSGLRDKSWGIKKQFREGQTEQILDTLYFDFIALAKKLQSKIVITENVSALRTGLSEIKYTPKIVSDLELAGYSVMSVILNASNLNVPQNRSRVFFIGILSRYLSHIKTNGFIKIPSLIFPTFPLIKYNEIEEKLSDFLFHFINKETKFYSLWLKCDRGKLFSSVNNGAMFNKIKLAPNLVCNTITAHCDGDLTHYETPRYISDLEIKRASSWPLDYDFNKQKVGYVCGMSVPPVMMAQVANAVREQWLDKINSKEKIKK